ncbi:sulfite exporter TauE/SafE family protein [Arcanobacterium buesumense]|uniref:Probable membrane transporter protein n=1 Tax=Arcanobacterium buesumense TaxID=2722751 RepID=A0A6H2EKD4_9ACTO|nr:sulfite exporter TauE/SafE family protein [Arcanobacterium buesumense]QJC21092.1 sulfite exporter TauE/SafE family protein [Arcanobacterium buesumense]
MSISTTGLCLLIIGSFFVGLSKTALPGLTTLSVVIFAVILPPKESTAALLILLLVGDVFAIKTWYKYADWVILRKLISGVLIGVAIGAVFLTVVPGNVLRQYIGIMLISLTLMSVLSSFYNTKKFTNHMTSPIARWFYGSLAGFTTMTANSGGPVTSLYFLASGYPIAQFLGTQAWFFFLVNLTKLPFTIGLGLLTVPILSILPYLIPFVIIGALLGRKIITYFSQRVFNQSIIILTLISSVYLVV